MIGRTNINANWSHSEKFLIEKLLEQIFFKTIDSHRVRLNNPKCILTEVNYVLSDLLNKKIKSFDKTVKPALIEAAELLKDDKTIIYKRWTKVFSLGY